MAKETQQQATQMQVGRSAALMSALIILSRLTGFIRTWAEARTLGATMLTSCYEVANFLPNQIYELVTAGMLTTAFLPVYISVKKNAGKEGSDDYVSNITSITVLFTGIITVISFIFASQIIWTQSFSAVEDFDSARATWFLRFFLIEIVLYACSTILSAALNAERDYLWPSLAPVFNNLIVTASFFLYSAFAASNPQLALLCLAIGNPLGVLVQVLIQMPSMIAHGIRPRWRIDLKDPAIKSTLQIGLPSVVVMVLFFVISSLQVNAALSITSLGAAVNSYSAMWYNLPYAIFAVPIMTALFTELSSVIAAEDMASFRRMLSSGIEQILFALIPFSCFLAIFAAELVTLISSGRFEADAAEMVALFLVFRAPSLPLMGIANYLQKACSALRKTGLYAGAYLLSAVIEIILLQTLTPVFGLYFVAFSSFIYRMVFTVFMLYMLHRSVGEMDFVHMIGSSLRSLLMGVLGSLVAIAILALLGSMGISGQTMSGALMRCVIAGLPAVVVSYGLALFLKIPETAALSGLIGKALKRGE